MDKSSSSISNKESKKERKTDLYLSKAFLILCLLFLLLPTLGMGFSFNFKETKQSSQTQESDLSASSDSGNYFKEHLAFKEPMITLNSILLRAISSSSLSSIVMGKNGVLFDAAEISDYQGLIEYDERDYFNIASNLKLIQDYILSKESRFRLILVPDKAQIREEEVPDRFIKAKTSSLQKMEEALKAQSINVVSISEQLEPEDYFIFDTHWNNRGALKAYNSLMQSLGLESEPFELSGEIDHAGDLSQLLYPSLNYLKEKDPYDSKLDVKVLETQDYEQAYGQNKEGVLLFYSDSFGQALFPFLANSFGASQHHDLNSMNPMNLIAIEQAKPTTVIMERAQSQMARFEESAPLMIMPELEEIGFVSELSDSTIESEEQGSFLYLSGVVKADDFKDNTKLYIRIHNPLDPQSLDHYFPVFYLGKTLVDEKGALREELVVEGESDPARNQGYGLYLPLELFNEEQNVISLLMQNEGESAKEIKTIQASLDELKGLQEQE